MLKLHQLQALVAVVDQGSIRSAARAMHVTQAALTKALRQLEDDAGIALLQRSSRGVVLTEAGQGLQARARLICRQLALAQDDLRQAQGDDTGMVRVGLTPYLMLTVLGDAFRWFRKRYPKIELRLVEGLVTRALPALHDGTMDFAIVADSGDVVGRDLAMQRLKREPQTLVVRAGHPILSAPSPAAVAQLEWVLPGPYAEAVDDGLAALFAPLGLAAPAQTIRCDAMGAMALVRQSDAVCMMPLPLLAQPEAHGLVALRVAGLQPPSVDLVLLTPADVPLTPAAAYLARCLVDAIAAGSAAEP